MIAGISIMLFYMLKFKFDFFGGGTEEDYWFGISPEGFGSVAMIFNFFVAYFVNDDNNSQNASVYKKNVDNIRVPENE